MTEAKKIFLDARELEHPIPLERAISALRELNDANYFYMIHRKNPVPLIDMANEQGFKVLNREDEHAVWHILVTRNQALDLEELCNV